MGTATQNVKSLFGISSSVDPGFSGNWPDVTATTRINKIRDRIQLSGGAAFTGNRSGTQAGFVADATAGANWAPRDSALFVAQDFGLMAITGFTSNTNINMAGGEPTECIAVAGFVIGNKAGRSSHALYGDSQFQAGSAAFGLELALKNKSAISITNTAYAWSAATGFTIGQHIVAGGDPSYGGANATPLSVAINLTTNTGGNATFNTGIRIQANAITGTNGYSGTGRAIAMAKGHAIEWGAGDVNHGATIRSDVSDVASNDVALIFSNNLIDLNGTANMPILKLVHNPNAVNYLEIQNRTPGASVRLIARGTDANIDVEVVPKGSGMEASGNPASAAATPASFTATHFYTRRLSGTVYYFPCRLFSW